MNGANILQWNERKDAVERVLEVTLKERTAGAYSLRVELVKLFSERDRSPVAAATQLRNVSGTSENTSAGGRAAGGDRPQSGSLLPLAGVLPLGTQKLSGFVSVAAEPGVSVKTATFDGLTEIPVGLLPSGSVVASDSGLLAFKFIAAETGVAAAWKLSVTTETVEPWLRAEVASTLTVSETLVNGRALVRFDIQNAPVKELRLKIPATLKNVEITGANIRRRDHTGEVWRVELQNKVRGSYTLTVTWDQTRSAQVNLLDLAGLSVEGVERETGTLAIAAKAPLQVTESKAADLLKLDTHEWPEWAGQPDTNVALAYRYLRPGYKLAVEAKRYSEAEVLQALAESFHLTTVVAEDGQMMTSLSVAVRNNGRQHLEMVLPPGTTVWSAFVAGRAVRPSLRDGKLLLPLENAGSDDAALTVELTYVSTNQNQFPRGHGKVNLVSPTLDVPMKNARWELYLPPDYQYDQFTGTMTREAGVVVATVADMPVVNEESSFSVWDYSKRESVAKADAEKDLKSEIYNAKKKLAEGNVKEAANYFSRTKNRGVANSADGDAEAKAVEKQLRQAQASNLVQAQQEFTTRNNALADQQLNWGMSSGTARDKVGVDLNAAAEQQWEKLQAAQEVAVAKVRPLRVNLPTRGLRHAFAQVLQAEPGKPMTVSFLAENAKQVNWPKRVATGLAGFLALWVVVAFVSGRVSSRERHA